MRPLARGPSQTRHVRTNNDTPRLFCWTKWRLLLECFKAFSRSARHHGELSLAYALYSSVIVCFIQPGGSEYGDLKR